MEKQTIIKSIGLGAVAVAAFVWLGGFIQNKPVTYRPMKTKGEALTREDIEYLEVEAPEATGSDGTVTAADWQETYPHIVASMGAMEENSFTVDYLEESPYLVNIYEGYGFAKDYKSARGHNYTLEDVANTARPHPLANCLTCKTPNMARMVQEMGESVYSMDFEEVYSKMEETVSCYTCHGNDPGNAGQLEVTHTYISDRLGDQMDTIDPAVLSCGQCHIEYYFKPENKATSVAYTSVAEMTPAAILAYYDSIGFSDWTQESTGAQLLKAQHPEMETFLQGKHAALLNCADCHMPLVQADDGTVYHDHNFQSPLENEALLETCVQCHGDKNMVSYVKSIQDEVTAKETEVGNELSAFKDALAAAVAEGSISEEELNKLRKIYREAQWYFDYCYVENSEGAHNSALAHECLNTAKMKVNEGMELLA
jgi:nitrite reductase (cytochrome c-552)